MASFDRYKKLVRLRLWPNQYRRAPDLGVTAVFLPAASEAIMYVLMAVILLVRPRGLLGEEGMLT